MEDLAQRPPEPQNALAVVPAPAVPRAPGQYGPFARWVLGHLFNPVPFPADAVPGLRAVAERATPVYVLRSSSLLHLLFFNWTFWKLGLPVARAATGLGYRIFTPFARWYLGGPQVRAPGGTQERATAQVIEAVRRGEAAMVFLRMPRTLPSAVAQLSRPIADVAITQIIA